MPLTARVAVIIFWRTTEAERHRWSALRSELSEGRRGAGAGRVRLVAPPSPLSPEPAMAQFLPPPLDAGAVRAAVGGTILVCSDEDPWCPEGAATAYGVPLRLPTTVIAGGGHLNVDAGYGPWPAAERWCSRPNLAFPL